MTDQFAQSAISEQEFMWLPSHRYKSHDGAGPETAAIFKVSDGLVHMERWKNKRRYAVNFTLPIEFLSSPACGWRRVK